MKRRPLVVVAMTVAVALASAWSIFSSVHTFCEERPRLTVLATLAAFLIALCFRQLGVSTTGMQRWLLVGCLAVAAVTLFSDARVVVRYGHLCSPTKPQAGPQGGNPSE